MPNKLPLGKVQTVLGPIEPEKLGATLTHEHLLIDLRNVVPTPPTGAWQRGLYEAKLTSDNIAWFRHHGMFNVDNYLLEDLDTAVNEALLYKRSGGQALVDATNQDIGRDPLGLAAIAQQTGLNIIMGASHYVNVAHPPEMAKWTEDDIVEQIVGDISIGVDGTDIKSGVIGEVGCSWPLTPNERKVVRAAGRAQRITGAPILIHPGRDETAPLEIIEVLSEVGADLSHTIMGHLDRTVFERATLKSIAEAGCFLEWDLFGREQSYYWANQKIDMPHDAQRMDDIAWISGQGYADRILVAHDICTKDRLLKYGGHGYHYFLSHIVPRMKKRGYTQEAIDKMLVANPAKALTFHQPKRR
ncbi:MAG: phosphotriesterase-related protein [SAR202 cluster bacterium]|nr:phosphotriesterase-related protein [SAR202 cluster bacterium]